MSRKQFNNKADPFESDSDDEIIETKVNNSIKFNQIKKHYLYVPFEYKDEVKKLGARFDFTKKEWYILDNHENKDKLINLYHGYNFYAGKYMIKYPLTLEQLKEKEKNENKEKEELKKNWIKKFGNDAGFGEWYSVQYLNHD